MTTAADDEAERAVLDAEYSPSLTAKDFRGNLETYALASAATKKLYAQRGLFDQRYGQRERALLDAFPARRGTSSPIHMFIHGGFWQELSKEHAAFPAPAFVASGSAFVAVNYTLAPAATLAEIVQEIRDAFAWVRDNARSFGGDPGRIVVSGHSAGAYLAAALIAGEGARITPGLAGLCGLVLISGVYDVEPIRRSYVNDALGLRREDTRQLNLAHAPPIRDVPVCLVVGADETKEFRRQNRLLHESWSPRLSRCQHVELEGRDHFDILFDLARPNGALHKVAIEFAGIRS